MQYMEEEEEEDKKYVISTGAEMRVQRVRVKNKPNLSYASMIVLAIDSVPERQMTAREIFVYMQKQWPNAFRSWQVSWKNSVRHNLSMNDCFAKVKKEAGKKALGHKWTLTGEWQVMFLRQCEERDYRQSRFPPDSGLRPEQGPPNPAPVTVAQPPHPSQPDMFHVSGPSEGPSGLVPGDPTYGHQEASGEFTSSSNNVILIAVFRGTADVLCDSVPAALKQPSGDKSGRNLSPSLLEP